MKIVAAKKFTRSPPESNLRSSFLGLSANQNCNYLTKTSHTNKVC